MIEVKGFGMLSKYTEEELEIEKNATVKDVLNSIGVEQAMQDSLVVMKNGKICSPLDRVKDGDKLELFILLSGG